MGSLDHYRQAIRELIERHASYRPAHGNIDSECVIDAARDHYELIRIGWNGPERIHGVVFHIDIIDGKIWIQYDGTSPGAAVELVEAGVPAEDIVLGFRPPHLRKYSGFAA